MSQDELLKKRKLENEEIDILNTSGERLKMIQYCQDNAISQPNNNNNSFEEEDQRTGDKTNNESFHASHFFNNTVEMLKKDDSFETYLNNNLTNSLINLNNNNNINSKEVNQQNRGDILNQSTIFNRSNDLFEIDKTNEEIRNELYDHFLKLDCFYCTTFEKIIDEEESSSGYLDGRHYLLEDDTGYLILKYLESLELPQVSIPWQNYLYNTLMTKKNDEERAILRKKNRLFLESLFELNIALRTNGPKKTAIGKKKKLWEDFYQKPLIFSGQNVFENLIEFHETKPQIQEKMQEYIEQKQKESERQNKEQWTNVQVPEGIKTSARTNPPKYKPIPTDTQYQNQYWNTFPSNLSFKERRTVKPSDSVNVRLQILETQLGAPPSKEKEYHERLSLLEEKILMLENELWRRDEELKSLTVKSSPKMETRPKQEIKKAKFQHNIKPSIQSNQKNQFLVKSNQFNQKNQFLVKSNQFNQQNQTQNQQITQQNQTQNQQITQQNQTQNQQITQQNQTQNQQITQQTNQQNQTPHISNQQTNLVQPQTGSQDIDEQILKLKEALRKKALAKQQNKEFFKE